MTAALALDLGTTSIKAALMDRQGHLMHLITRPVPVMDIHHGHYESNALHYAETAEAVLEECLNQTNNKPPLGLCSQRSSFLIWDKASGQPVTPLISWQDDRGSSACERLQANSDTIHTLTGLQLTPYYFGPKLSALLQENPAWCENLSLGNWLTGTLDTFIIWRLTTGRHFVTDASMAARTLLMDISRLHWSDTLCQLFNIPRTILSEILPSVGLNLPLNNGLTLQASIGDQSAALISSLTQHSSHEALVNLGTGGFVIRSLANDEPALSGYLQTLVYQNEKRQTQFSVEGTLNSIAAALAPYPVSECSPQDLATTDIFCLAEPSGLGAPFFRKDYGLHFSQTLSGLTQQQIAALLLEAIIFRVARILEEFHHQRPLTQIYLSGGLSELPILQHGIAQCISIPVAHLPQKETSLQGTAILASGLTISCHNNTDNIVISHVHHALINKYQRWKKWLDALLGIRTR